MLKKIGKIIIKLLSILTFFGVCFIALFFANGYQYDLNKKDVKRTSIIDLVSDFKEVRVLLDGKLMANFLPFQIKDLDLGEYDLDVNKVGYQPWKRHVRVDADFVTIVNDIILIPEKLDALISHLKLFNDGATLVYGNDEMISVKVGESHFTLNELSFDKKKRDIVVEIPQALKSGIEKLDVLSDDIVLLSLADGDKVLYSFQSEKFEKIELFSKAMNIKVYGNSIMFVYDGALYSVDKWNISKIDLSNISNYLVRDDVDNFVQGVNYNFIINNNSLYKVDSKYKNEIIIPCFFNGVENLSFVKGRDYGLLTVRGLDQIRKLFLVNRNGDLMELSKSFIGSGYINGFDQIVYIDKNAIHYYDSLLDIDKIIRNVDTESEILGWYDVSGHYLINENGKLVLEDIFNANHYELMDMSNVGKVIAKEKRLFFVKLNSLYVLDLTTKE